MSFELNGAKISKILPPEEGTSKAGKQWKKVVFVCETDEQYNNTYAFEIFQGEGKTKADDFISKYNVGDTVNVTFNVSCNEWNGKYFTGLAAYQYAKIDESTGAEAYTGPAPEDFTPMDDSEELPF